MWVGISAIRVLPSHAPVIVHSSPFSRAQRIRLLCAGEWGLGKPSMESLADMVALSNLCAPCRPVATHGAYAVGGGKPDGTWSQNITVHPVPSDHMANGRAAGRGCEAHC